ncbi:hypothetical protein CVT26_002426 [Gymnopilus dilepis]|uniref:Uncharacterized protein n=1 Tax=Gymnopilus dilepis TaxID=231916 RepID=A0A409WEE0_9AGAR|nr:hypothetical protein CVT26_002426 [Gymnopilus dilepis]
MNTRRAKANQETARFDIIRQKQKGLGPGTAQDIIFDVLQLNHLQHRWPETPKIWIDTSYLTQYEPEQQYKALARAHYNGIKRNIAAGTRVVLNVDNREISYFLTAPFKEEEGYLYYLIVAYTRSGQLLDWNHKVWPRWILVAPVNQSQPPARIGLARNKAKIRHESPPNRRMVTQTLAPNVREVKHPERASSGNKRARAKPYEHPSLPRAPVDTMPDTHTKFQDPFPLMISPSLPSTPTVTNSPTILVSPSSPAAESPTIPPSLRRLLNETPPPPTLPDSSSASTSNKCASASTCTCDIPCHVEHKIKWIEFRSFFQG